MHISVLAREELRIFEELISRFDLLSEAEMRTVGVTRVWSAKDLLAYLVQVAVYRRAPKSFTNMPGESECTDQERRARS